MTSISKTKIPNPKNRFQLKGIEIIYDDTGTMEPKEALEHLKTLKYGVYAGFLVKHTENGKSHIHIGIHLRDKPQLYYATLTEHFKYKDYKTTVRQLMNKSKAFSAKLQTYYNYCINEEKHEGQLISEPLLYRWTPTTKLEAQTGTFTKCSEYMYTKIRDGLTLDGLEAIIVDKCNPAKLFEYILRNIKQLKQSIEDVEDIRFKKLQAENYTKMRKTYRPFQEALAKKLDTQNDRHILAHFDCGITGKNWFYDIEDMREDTLCIQSAETKRVAAVWNPKKHRRIIFDIPAGKMRYLNTSMIEKLKNGSIFDTMNRPRMKRSLFKPAILILGNERIDYRKWTEDRLTETTTNRVDYILEEVKTNRQDSFADVGWEEVTNKPTKKHSRTNLGFFD